MSATWILGQSVKLIGTFTVDGEAADPSAFKFTFEEKDTTTKIEYDQDSPEVKQDSQGVYHVIYTPTVAGSWNVRIEFTGETDLSEIVKSASELTFNIWESRIA